MKYMKSGGKAAKSGNVPKSSGGQSKSSGSANVANYSVKKVSSGKMASAKGVKLGTTHGNSNVGM